MLKFATGAAAIALLAGAVAADPGHGGGKGGGQGKGGGTDRAGHAMPAPGGESRGGKANREDRGNRAKPDEARGPARNEPRPDRGRNANVDKAPDRDSRPNEARAAKRGDRPDDAARGVNREPRGPGRDDRRGADDRGRFTWREAIPPRARGIVAGCPPGLAKKGNGCMPPGQARALAPAAVFDDPTWWAFDRQWYGDVDWDERYRFHDGYLVEYDDEGIEGWIPLLGGALSPGSLWPANYEPVALPGYYQDYYGLGPVDSYRYYDDVLYRIDPQTEAITTVAGLLTGDDFAVGQALPPGYDVYNVPYGYRDEYADGPDASYRYSDGYVYRVDPVTQLIEAAISLPT